MNLHEKAAIIFKDVSKTYKLYQNQWQMVRDAFRTINKRQQIPEFHALKHINLTIDKGERIGLIGRNGAGKSTLLKLITGNFRPTTGQVIIHGSIQALMNMGVGFHPEFTGLENIKASLLYNGLEKNNYEKAIQDVIEFVELGDFLEQPLKTYSLGMQSRLYFAVATAIEPEILIIDEVLSAGDAYFSAKSADRIKKLTQCGCTLLLVSHSTSQILQFCEQAVWIECGEVVMKGNALEVVKSYEEFSKKLEVEAKKNQVVGNKNIATQSVIQSKWLKEKLLKHILSQHLADYSINLNKEIGKDFFNNQNSISRWPSLEPGLKILEIQLLTINDQIVQQARTGESLNIKITIGAEKKDNYDVYFVILIFTEQGQWLARHCSKKFQLNLNEGEKYSVQLKYKELLLGQGKYIFSAAIYKILDLHDLSTARYYDLLARSFELEVEGPYNYDPSLFHPPAKWEEVS